MIGRKIGEGACAEIFEWNSEDGACAQIIKLARSHLGRQAMLEEFHHNQVAWSLGLPVPRAFDLVDVGGRFGIVYERVYGKSALERLIDQALAGSGAIKSGATGAGAIGEGGSRRSPTPPKAPKAPTTQMSPVLDVSGIFDDFRHVARVLSRVHGHSVDHLPSQREDIKSRLQRAEELTGDEKALILAILDDLPDKSQLCHGDPHPGNFMIHGAEATVIDWMDAAVGSPEADVADFVVLVRFSVLPDELPQDAVKWIDSLRERMIQEFLSEYERMTGIGLERIDAWIAPMAARRLTMGARQPEEKVALVAEIRRRLGRMSRLG